MKLACHLLGHQAVPHAVANRGFRFSRCRRCRCDMVRSNQPASSKWIVVPPAFRVAWNDVDPDELFKSRQSRPTRGVRATLAAAIECARVTLFVTPVMMRKRFAELIAAVNYTKPQLRLLTSINRTPTNREWLVNGSMRSVNTKLHFMFIIQKHEGALVCG